jgi:hypothetical protein
LGVGSYFEDPVEAGVWIQVVGVADGTHTSIYRDGALRRSDSYVGKIIPAHGPAPLRIGTRDFASFFLGSIRRLRLWNRALGADEVAALFGTDQASTDGLVAEYLLDHDVARDTAGAAHDGIIRSAGWLPDSSAP